VATRALILTWEYPPIVEGGLARHVRHVSEGLARRGVEVHVLTRGAGELPETAVQNGVHVHRIEEPPFPKDDLDAFVKWVGDMNRHMRAAGDRLAAEHDVDLVHGHDWLVARACASIADRHGLPYLTTIHATEYGRHQGWVQKYPQRHIHATEKWMARRADGVIVCSHYMRGHVADIYGIEEERVAVIPNGIDPADLRTVDDLEALRARFAAPDERLILLIGRLVYEKGFQLALDALPGLIRRLGNVRFLVAGSGTHEAELRKQAEELGLMEHGTFAGWIGDDVLHSLYRIADLCVVPSIYEPFGIVALEAMVCGCPCIVADTGGLREVVPNPNVGLRFRPRDARSLAGMVERVLTDDVLRDRLVAEASEHVLGFDWAEIAQQTLGVYATLAAGAMTGTSANDGPHAATSSASS
jgi:glycogen(starch) synthase